MTVGLGHGASWGAIILLAAAAIGSLRGHRWAAGAHRAGAVLAVVATATLAWALATGDFTLRYVAETSERSSSWWFRLSGLWGAMAGSLLLWTSFIAVLGAARRRAPDGVERAVLAGIAAVFLAVDAVLADPFERLAAPALDGLGLTPILEHPAMLYHPPILYLGLTSLAVPFAAVVAGSATTAGLRRQLLACWAVLTAGMVAGAHWAYVELGWGGFWAWDPVENTSLLPWLAALGALHALRGGAEERRPTVAGPALAAGAFVLAAFGTTLTRSGLAPSVHAFAEDPAIGRALVGIVVALAVLAAMAIGRSAGAARDAGVPLPLRSLDRRRRALRIQPWLAGLALAVVLIGTARPLFGDAAVAVEGSFYAPLVAPLAVAAVVVMAAGGVLRVGRRMRAGHLAHLGFVVLLVGAFGSGSGGSASATVEPGGSLSVAGWEVRNDGVRVVGGDGEAVVADVTLRHGGDDVATLHPSLVAHPDQGGVLAETSLRSTPLSDVQVVLRDADDAGRALLVVHVRPLVWWVWWGGLLLAASAAWAAKTNELGVATST